MTFGPHLMIDGNGCDKQKLSDENLIRNFLLDLTKEINMTKIGGPYVLRYKDRWAATEGVTGVVIFAESHATIHTFPDSNYVFIDVFSCKEFDIKKAKRFIKKYLKIKKMKTRLTKRGTDFLI